MKKYCFNYTSPLGCIKIISDGLYITNMFFDNNIEINDLHDYIKDGSIIEPFRSAIIWLDKYFYGINPDFTPPIKVEANDFCLEVWKRLMNIPYGTTTTYGKIAKEISKNRTDGRQSSARAVGQVIKRNPIILMIPCHRVIGTNGNITGYAAGIDKKIWLLNHEKPYVKF